MVYTSPERISRLYCEVDFLALEAVPSGSFCRRLPVAASA